MIEARVTCKCQSLKLPDVGLNLTLGQVAFVEEKLARKSKDLARASRASGITVEYIERVKSRR